MFETMLVFHLVCKVRTIYVVCYLAIVLPYVPYKHILSIRMELVIFD
jgi:hypothetical protein